MRSDSAADDMAPIRARLLQRVVTVLLILIVAVTFAASSASISRELHHDCTGDGCAVCAQMANGLHLSRAGCTALGAVPLLEAILLAFAFLVLGAPRQRIRLTTLVSLKVQLND